MSEYRPRAKTLSPEAKRARDTLPWRDDYEAQALVAENPGGLTLEAIGEWLELSRERVRQIEAGALRKLREGAQLSRWQRHAALHPGEPGEYAPPWG